MLHLESCKETQSHCNNGAWNNVTSAGVCGRRSALGRGGDSSRPRWHCFHTERTDNSRYLSASSKCCEWSYKSPQKKKCPSWMVSLLTGECWRLPVIRLKPPVPRSHKLWSVFQNGNDFSSTRFTFRSLYCRLPFAGWWVICSELFLPVALPFRRVVSVSFSDSLNQCLAFQEGPCLFSRHHTTFKFPFVILPKLIPLRFLGRLGDITFTIQLYWVLPLCTPFNHF